MNPSEAKSILLLYRPGMADAEEPPMTEALALAKSNPELSRWLEAHCAAQEALRAKFRQIAPPAGLKEQIISEHAAGKRAIAGSPAMRLALAGVFLLLLLGTLAVFWFPRPVPVPENAFAEYQDEMANIAMRGYMMDTNSTELPPLQEYLAQHKAPADFKLAPGLQKVSVVGCSVENWQGAKVSLICFRTGKPLPQGAPADLWLFVADRASVKDAPIATTPQFVKINKLITATWTEGDKLYFLGVEGGESDIKQYLL